MKKTITWLSILLLIAGAIAGWFWLQQRNLTGSDAIDILRSAEISRDDMVITVPASGTIVGNRSNILNFMIPGLVQEVYVKVGDQVKTGQLLASIDSRDLQRAVEVTKITLEQAKLNLSTITKLADQQDIELAEIAIKDAQNALTVAELNRELATAQSELSNRMAREVRDDVQQVYFEFQKTLERYNLPYAYGAGINAANMEADGNVGITALKGNYNIQQAGSSWWAAYSGLQQAEQSLSDLLSAVDIDTIKQAELQIEQAQLNVEQAEQRLADGTITAPYDGTIIAVNIIKGLDAPARLPALMILDNNALYADVSIDEIDIANIKLEQAAEIILDAFPDVTVKGFVQEIEEVPSNLSGIVSYNVRIALDDQQSAQPRDGMTTSVYITTRTIEDILLIPNWAIRTDQTTTDPSVYCYSLIDGIPQRTTIETGFRNDMVTQVLAGLDEGATIVLITEERNLFDLGGPPRFAQ